MAKVATTLRSEFFSLQPYILDNGFRTAAPKRAILKGVGFYPFNPNRQVALEVVFPFGPQNLEYASYEGKFSQIERPYRKPILAYENQQLRTVTFNALIADKASGGTRPIEDMLDNIETMSKYGWRCSFIYGLTSLTFDVAVTKFSYTVKYRNTDGAPIRAEASIQLTEMPSLNQEITLLNAVFRQPESETGVVTGGGDGSTPSSGVSGNDTASVDPNQEEAVRNYRASQPAFINESTQTLLDTVAKEYGTAL